MTDTQLINVSRTQLRRELRQQRRALNTSYRKIASQRVKTQLARAGWLRCGKRIAVYLATTEELNLQPLIEFAWQQGCQVFIPHITNTRRKSMAFYPFNRNSRLITHRWGIKQFAATSSPIATRNLDVVLLPTVGFDRAGHRLGMGGGFYDRHFANLRRTCWRKPFLIGAAYACQEISAIDTQPHDIQLDAIITEHEFTFL